MYFKAPFINSTDPNQQNHSTPKFLWKRRKRENKSWGSVYPKEMVLYVRENLSYLYVRENLSSSLTERERERVEGSWRLGLKKERRCLFLALKMDKKKEEGCG